MDYDHANAKVYPLKTWSRFICAGILFALIFWSPWHPQKNWVGESYFLSRDTNSYINFAGWTSPWRAIRSIGYPAFIYPFIYQVHGKYHKVIMDASRNKIDAWQTPEEPIYSLASESGIAEKFELIGLAQRVILALGVTVFFLSLCRWFSPIFSFFGLCIALGLAPPPNPLGIMTEPLSCALTWLCAGFLLFAPKSKKRSVYYALACFCAGFSFLVRPQTLSLTGICSFIFIYEVVDSVKYKNFSYLFKKIGVFSPLLLSYGYIAWLSVTGGSLFFYTLHEIPYSSFCFFADAEDAANMPTERSRKFTSWFGEHKEELIHKMENKINLKVPEDASPPWIRRFIGDGLLYGGGLGEVWHHFNLKKERGLSNLTRLQRATLAKELSAGLQKRHRAAIFVNRWQNFLAGLGYYKDIYRFSYLSGATFLINIVALALSLGAIGLRRGIRWPVTIMVAIHLMALLAAAFGHHVIARYVEPTEPLLLLAGICSLWAICRRALVRFQIQKDAGAPEMHTGAS